MHAPLLGRPYAHKSCLYESASLAERHGRTGDNWPATSGDNVSYQTREANRTISRRSICLTQSLAAGDATTLRYNQPSIGTVRTQNSPQMRSIFRREVHHDRSYLDVTYPSPHRRRALPCYIAGWLRGCPGTPRLLGTALWMGLAPLEMSPVRVLPSPAARSPARTPERAGRDCRSA
jgi:hypothetical protein